MLTSAPLATIVGFSDALRKALDLAARYARIPNSVTLIGPTGVGKGVLAAHIHALSGAPGAFVTLKGGQIIDSLYHSQFFGYVKGAYTGSGTGMPGVFEQAHDGTLFLDELHLWSAEAQAAVLGAVDERRVLPVGAKREIDATCRLLFAANRPLDDLVRDGVLTLDLRYRIGPFAITVPALVERRVDIAVLAFHFLDGLRVTRFPEARVAFDADAFTCLLAYAWPGNVRELKDAVTYGCVHAAGRDRIGPEHLPPPVASAYSSTTRIDPRLRNQLVHWAVKRGRTRREAARLLGVHVRTIDYHLRRVAN